MIARVMFTSGVVLGITMVDLTEHESRVFDLIKQNPEILGSKQARTKIASDMGMSEKTLRNRIGDLRRYGLLDETSRKQESTTPSITQSGSNELNQSTYVMAWVIASVASLAIFIIYF
tara:strand:+ start:1406 stop:1759 length:354 start_codon:yes stop_codon:yes gene_type:complete